LDQLKENGQVAEWEIPYENLLTRCDAAIYFLTAKKESDLEQIWVELGRMQRFKCQRNEKKTLSQLDWQVEFKKEELISDVHKISE